jgi:hypothetical protein
MIFAKFIKYSLWMNYLGRAVAKMFALSTLAFNLVAIDIGDGKKAGPSFEYIPSH